MNLNLSKEETINLVNISLSKAGYDDVTAKVAIVLDGSGSMQHLYRNGTVQSFVNKALAIGHKFDDDGNIDVFDFSDGTRHRMLPQATQDDFGTYMNNKTMLGGCTEFYPVLSRVEDFYFKAEAKKRSLGNLFGLLGGGEEGVPEGRDDADDKHPVFIIFITDGDSHSNGKDTKVLTKLFKEHPDVFIHFAGISSTGTGFNQLAGFDQMFDNASYSALNLSTASDQEVIESFLNPKAKAILSQNQ